VGSEVNHVDTKELRAHFPTGGGLLYQEVQDAADEIDALRAREEYMHGLIQRQAATNQKFSALLTESHAFTAELLAELKKLSAVPK
jgi:hypothetical protein